MKILFIVPGSGDMFYCGNCFRDNLYASALRKAGHEVIIMPLYLPLKQPSFEANTPLFFPAPAFYAAQKLFSKRRMPRWIECILRSKPILNIASSFSGSTSAKGLEDITLSMIYGDDAVFADQAEALTGWIKNKEKPDVIHLSSTLLIGIAKAIKQQVEIPIVCSLQDEEIWIDTLEAKHATIAWEGIARNIKYIDRFITTSEFYKNVAYTQIPQLPDIEVIYPGVDAGKYASEQYPKEPVIGFFYRMNKENGLDILAEAFVKLKKRGSIKNLKLKVAGGYTAKDKQFLKQVRKLLQPYTDDVFWHDSYSLEGHAGFYGGITIISVPVTFNEGVGLYICEAFAAGRPAVEPATGSFDEIVGNAGVLYSPNDSEALANAIEGLLADEPLFARCRKNALSLSRTRYNDYTMAEKLCSLYQKLIR